MQAIESVVHFFAEFDASFGCELASLDDESNDDWLPPLQLLAAIQIDDRITHEFEHPQVDMAHVHVACTSQRHVVRVARESGLSILSIEKFDDGEEDIVLEDTNEGLRGDLDKHYHYAYVQIDDDFVAKY